MQIKVHELAKMFEAWRKEEGADMTIWLESLSEVYALVNLLADNAHGDDRYFEGVRFQLCFDTKDLLHFIDVREMVRGE